MASERYVRPPLLAREAPAAWIAVWRFRLVALALLAVLVLIAVLLFRQLTGDTEQDPGVGALHHLMTTRSG
ncbi:MAG: hypothetical protein H7323_16055 [Frankiales bacterium]|nr:hypothetical protein [Frankiales bacterium]